VFKSWVEMLLIVDDNEDILFNLKIMLEKMEYEVVTARSGEEALNLLSSNDIIPEVIISDIMMPNMNGYEFFSAVSAHPSLNRVPFLFLTAKSTPEDIRLGKLLGVNDYITKPFNEEDLIASLLEILILNTLFLNPISYLFVYYTYVGMILQAQD